MSQITEQLNELKTQLADFVADVDARLDQLRTAQGTFEPEAQEIFDGIKQRVADEDAKVGDADGSDTPATPSEPVESAPVEPSEPAEPVTPAEPVNPTPTDGL